VPASAAGQRCVRPICAVARLVEADVRETDFTEADLREANLRKAAAGAVEQETA
jgi:uncharacterized protein YjbI with pentapeptide repeats